VETTQINVSILKIVKILITKNCENPNNCVNSFQVLINAAKYFPRTDCSETLFSLIN